MSTLVVSPLPGVGLGRRLWCALRGLVSRRILLTLAGVRSVQLEGQVFAVRPVPLGVARDMVPALLRCAKSIAVWDVNEQLYDDFVVTLSLGLGVPAKRIERLQVPLWQLAPVVELIARVNGFPEAGRADLGKLMAMITSTGTPSSPGSAPTPDGPGSTSSDA